MKPEELQMYDWVLINDKPYQVKQITRKKVGYHRIPYNLDYARLVDIKPIPITAEILEKNGFKVVTYPLGNVACIWGDDYKNSILWSGLMITVRHWDNSKDYHGCAEYIHELQQALRLCGIDKRIEL